MPEVDNSTAIDPAATDVAAENTRDGARKRRDPNEAAAVVGIGASAGGIAPLQQFFEEMKPDSGLAFVVVMHLSPDFESQLAAVLQQKTKMPVVQVTEAVKVKPNHVYVIPPNHQLTFTDSTLDIVPPQQGLGRRVTIDLFFRTLAFAYGQRAVSIIMSGTDSDGVIGLKHIRAEGGVTIAQEPEEAEFDSMPLNAIATGMVDWVLHVADMPPRLLEFVRNEHAMQLPPEIVDAAGADVKVEDAPGGETVSDETRDGDDDEVLVLKHVRLDTGHDFGHYKRATVLRRIARRLQVNSLESIPRYLEFLRKHPTEVRALLHDLLIGVTHFFRDRAAFAAFEANVPQLFASKKRTDDVRVWVAGCATGEEAYSIGMVLCEHAEKLPDPPSIQIFATDIDEQAIHEARDALYPATIEADVSPERLRQFFTRDNGRYRVKKDLREKVLFATHNVLSDPAFSRVDLVSCRNLLIYLNREAQEQVFDIFHFALRPGGLFFIGSAETAEGAHALFSSVDSHHRIYVRRSVPRPTWRMPVIPGRTVPRPRRDACAVPMLPRMTSVAVEAAGEQSQTSTYARQERRSVLFGELHLKLLEEYGPPSVVVNEAHDIVHLSEHAGRYLAFRPGEPSTNLIAVVSPGLRVELRTALFRAAQSNEAVIVPAQRVPVEGTTETIDLQVRPIRPGDSAQGFFLVLFERKLDPVSAEEQAAERETISREVGDELQSLKEQLNSTVEQFEASSEELKAQNEELQAMNEELRSAAEELETSKEELQSVNEELITVNQELKDNVEELSRANSDLNNLMTSTDLATIFLDRQLRVVRFTPRVQQTFNLLPADIGRPISDITHKLRYETLMADAEAVLQRLAVIEREVETEEARTFLARISPYRTLDDRISGVVVTLIDVTQIKRAQAEMLAMSHQLVAQAHRFNTIMEAVPDFVYEFDIEGRFTYVNPALLTLWGLTAEEAVGKNFHQLDYTKELATKLQRQIQEVIDTREPLKDETPYTSVIGERMYEYLFFPIFGEEGKVEAVAGVTRDITERGRVELALRESEKRYRTLFDLIPVAVYTTDREGVIREFNQRAVELWGRIPDPKGQQFCGSFKIYYPDGRPMPHEQCPMARVLRGEQLQPADLEIVVEQEKGAHRNVAVAPRAVRDEQGRITGAINCLFDITDRKRAEALLRQSEERFRTVADNVPPLIWTNDAEGEANYFNQRMHEYSGLSYEDLAGRGWEAMVHPDDAPGATEKWRQALGTGKVFDTEYRLQRSDGEYRWFLGRNIPLQDDKGRVASWFGSATDIHDLKEAEAALRASEERYRLLVDGARDYAIFMMNPSNEIVYWSAGAERVFGWSTEEAVGQSGEIVFTPEDRETEQEEKEIEVALREGCASDRRWHLRKDGVRIWVDGVMRRLDDDKNGALRGFAKIARDATEQRKAEEELRKVHEQLEQRVRERTAELQSKNRLLEQEVARRRMLENEILEITDRERARIGQDLHDSLCQELTATAFLLKSRGKAIALQNRAAADSLVEAAETVNRNAGLARDLARGFHPFELGSAGLPSALRELCGRTNELVNCRCDCPRSLRLDQNVAVNLYRIAQEAVTNSAKHANASEIVISLERTDGELVLTISDNGQGKRRRGRGLGTHIMQYRARAAGGTLTVESVKGRGTTVTCRVPLGSVKR